MKLSKAELEAVIAVSPRSFVPLNKLALSKDYQARSAGSAPQFSISELAASIKENGVLQNLVVTEGSRGWHEVCAGGRRLEALKLLAANAKIAENYPVPVLLMPADQALIASLAENCFHVPMHPADEYVAFARLVAQGKSIEDVAAAFGVTPLVVKRRLKLASVSPNLMAQFRAGEIGLECLMVLASVDDHQRQEQAWAAAPAWNRRPDHLRQLLTQGEIESDRDPVARFVTLEAYEKAGGPLRRDLFSDSEQKAYLLDAALLETLAAQKLQKRVKQLLLEGWKWIDVRVRYAYDEYAKYGELRRTRRAPDPREAAALADFEARIDSLTERMEFMDGDDGDEAYSALDAQAEALEAQQKAILETLDTWPKDLIAQAGCVVHVGNAGEASVKRGLIRPEDRGELKQAASTTGENSIDASLISQPAGKGRTVHSERLLRCLTAHRVAALQAELVDLPHVALAAVTAQLAQGVFGGDPYDRRTLDTTFDIRARSTQADLRLVADGIEAGKAWTKLEAQRLAWTQCLPADPPAYLAWLLGQTPEVVLKLLTFVVAITIKGISATESEPPCNDALARAIGLDMRRWWSVSGESYLHHVPKARVVEVVTEAAGADAGNALRALKKGDAVLGAEAALAGIGWLPHVLRVDSEADAAPCSGNDRGSSIAGRDDNEPAHNA